MLQSGQSSHSTGSPPAIDGYPQIRHQSAHVLKASIQNLLWPTRGSPDFISRELLNWFLNGVKSPSRLSPRRSTFCGSGSLVGVDLLTGQAIPGLVTRRIFVIALAGATRPEVDVLGMRTRVVIAVIRGSIRGRVVTREENVTEYLTDQGGLALVSKTAIRPGRISLPLNCALPQPTSRLRVNLDLVPEAFREAWITKLHYLARPVSL